MKNKRKKRKGKQKKRERKTKEMKGNERKMEGKEMTGRKRTSKKHTTILVTQWNLIIFPSPVNSPVISVSYFDSPVGVKIKESNICALSIETFFERSAPGFAGIMILQNSPPC